MDRVHEELWMEVCDIGWGGSDQDHPQEKEMQKSKMVVFYCKEPVQIAEERSETKGKGEKERYYFSTLRVESECSVPKNSNER